MLARSICLSVLTLGVAALGCSSGSEAGGGSATASASGSAAPAASGTGTAAAAPAKPANKEEWIKLADSLEFKFTDQMDGEMTKGTIENKGAFPVSAANFWVYVYDKDGKQLERVKGEKSFATPLAPGKSADIKVGPLKNAKDAGIVIQAEVSWMRLPEGTMWQDGSRAPNDRPKKP